MPYMYCAYKILGKMFRAEMFMCVLAQKCRNIKIYYFTLLRQIIFIIQGCFKKTKNKKVHIFKANESPQKINNIKIECKS